jgi:hypothetical protein
VSLAAYLLAARLAELGAFLRSCPLHSPHHTRVTAGSANWTHRLS